jgi:DNA helicase-2/ATP-dependent DNA helicase PcrA
LAQNKFPSKSRGGDNPESSQAALPWWVRENSEQLPHWADVTGTAMTELVKNRNRAEEWRLFYVACTRARRRLVLSTAQWYAGPMSPQGPSELYEFVAAQADLVQERYRNDPADRDPRVVAMEAYRREAAAAVPPAPPPPKTKGKKPAPPTEIAMTLFDTVAPPPPPARPAPLALSVSALVSFARCPRQFHWSVVRPLPRRASTAATIGTAVHRWIETRHGPQGVLVDHEHPSTGVIAGLRASFTESVYAAAPPVTAEAQFDLFVGGHMVRGRVDAVYAHPDGAIELVDFKTGRPPAEGDPSAETQLLIYAIAAVDSFGYEPVRLRASFVYLQSDGSPAVAVPVDVAAERIDVARAWLADAVAKIDAHASGTNPGAWCGRCDFAPVCPAAPR